MPALVFLRTESVIRKQGMRLMRKLGRRQAFAGVSHAFRTNFR